MADLFTKSLPKSTFEKHVKSIGLLKLSDILCDLQVFYVQIILLTTRVKLIQKAFVAFNLRFYVFRSFAIVHIIWL